MRGFPGVDRQAFFVFLVNESYRVLTRVSVRNMSNLVRSHGNSSLVASPKLHPYLPITQLVAPLCSLSVDNFREDPQLGAIYRTSLNMRSPCRGPSSPFSSGEYLESYAAHDPTTSTELQKKRIGARVASGEGHGRISQDR